MRRRLDVELVRRGLVPSRTRAVEAIDAGRCSSAARPRRPPARQVDGGEAIALLAETGPTYVSRGGHKLAAGLDAFAIDVRRSSRARRRRVDRRLHRLPPAARRRARVRGRRRALAARVVVAPGRARDRDGAHEHPRRSQPGALDPRARSLRRRPVVHLAAHRRAEPRRAHDADADFVLLVKPQYEAGPGARRPARHRARPRGARGGAPRGGRRPRRGRARRAGRGRAVAVARRRRQRRVPRPRAAGARPRSTPEALDDAVALGPRAPTRTAMTGAGDASRRPRPASRASGRARARAARGRVARRRTASRSGFPPSSRPRPGSTRTRVRDAAVREGPRPRDLARRRRHDAARGAARVSRRRCRSSASTSGMLGYLSELEPEELEAVAARGSSRGEFEVSERMMLEVDVESDGRGARHLVRAQRGGRREAARRAT